MNGLRIVAPDDETVLNLESAKDSRRQNRYWLGADLVAEIVSPGDPERDTREKRLDYAEAGIPEYWIVTRMRKRLQFCSCEAIVTSKMVFSAEAILPPLPFLPALPCP